MTSRIVSSSRGIYFAIFANLLWGTTFVVSQYALVVVNPYNLVFLRSLTGSAIIFLIFLFSPYIRRQAFMQLGKPHIWILSGLYALGFLFQYLGQNMSNASNATLLSNLAPVFLPPVAAVILRERTTRMNAAVVIMGLAGLLIFSAGNILLDFSQIMGDVLLILTSVSYAFFIVLSKRFKAGGLESSFMVILIVSLMLFPVSIVAGHLTVSSLIMPIWAYADILWLGATGTVIALAFYLRSLQSISTTASGIFLLLQLIFGLGLAVIILGEKLTPYQIAGSLLILLSILVVSVGNLKESRAPEEQADGAGTS